MSRIQRDAPSAPAGKARACPPTGTPASDFSMLLVPGAVATPAVAYPQPRAESEASPESPPEHSTPGRRALPQLLEPEGLLETLLRIATPGFTSTPPSRAASRQTELDDDTVVQTQRRLPSVTEEGQDQAALALPPGLPNLCAPTSHSDQVALSLLPVSRSTPETTQAAPPDRVAPTLEAPVASELAAEVDQSALESAPADPELDMARAITPALDGAEAAPGAKCTLNLCPQVQAQAEQVGALTEAIENLPSPVRSWNGVGDRLFDLTAWARGLLSYAGADHALAMWAEPAAPPTSGPVAAGGYDPAVVTGMAVSPAVAHTKAQYKEPRALPSEISLRRAVDVETQSSTRDPQSVPELAEPAAPRQVLLVVRDDSAVLYVRDYFAQSAGLEQVVEQVRKLLLTRNRAGLRVVINGHWQSTEQIRRGSDGN